MRPSRVRKSIGAERTFFDDISDLTIMHQKLSEIAERVSNSLVKKDISGRTITLKIKYNNFQSNTRSRTLQHLVNDYDSIYNIAKELLYIPIPPNLPVRLLGISISNLNTGEQKSSPIQLTLDI